MKLAGQTWHTTLSHVSLGAETYRVVQPVKTPAHASLHDGYHGWHLSADRRATLELAAAWWLAARSRHSLILLPLRSSPALCGQEYNGGRLDLVLLHHSLAFPVSRWKRVRGGLGKGRPHKVTLPTMDFRRSRLRNTSRSSTASSGTDSIGAWQRTRCSLSAADGPSNVRQMRFGGLRRIVRPTSTRTPRLIAAPRSPSATAGAIPPSATHTQNYTCRRATGTGDVV